MNVCMCVYMLCVCVRECVCMCVHICVFWHLFNVLRCPHFLTILLRYTTTFGCKYTPSQARTQVRKHLYMHAEHSVCACSRTVLSACLCSGTGSLQTYTALRTSKSVCYTYSLGARRDLHERTHEHTSACVSKEYSIRLHPKFQNIVYT